MLLLVLRIGEVDSRWFRSWYIQIAIEFLFYLTFFAFFGCRSLVRETIILRFVWDRFWFNLHLRHCILKLKRNSLLLFLLFLTWFKIGRTFDIFVYLRIYLFGYFFRIKLISVALNFYWLHLLISRWSINNLLRRSLIRYFALRWYEFILKYFSLIFCILWKWVCLKRRLLFLSNNWSSSYYVIFVLIFYFLPYPCSRIWNLLSLSTWIFRPNHVILLIIIPIFFLTLSRFFMTFYIFLTLKRLII
jgi:hypothetical protein